MYTLKRSAFTLVELLVVLTIIAVVAAIALPAIQTARVTSYRVKCTNHVKAITQGIVAYQTRMGKFPKAATFEEYPNANPSDCTTSIIYQVITNPGNVSTTDQNRYMSNWVVDILADIDLKEESNNWTPTQPFFSTVSNNSSVASNSLTCSKSKEVMTCPNTVAVTSPT